MFLLMKYERPDFIFIFFLNYICLYTLESRLQKSLNSLSCFLCEWNYNKKFNQRQTKKKKKSFPFLKNTHLLYKLN